MNGPQATIRVIVNGDEREVAADMTVLGLLVLLSRLSAPVAVERNQEVVPRGNWHEVTLLAGDRLEIVSFVGGG